VPAPSDLQALQHIQIKKIEVVFYSLDLLHNVGQGY
jgi:hypothetical protein